MHLNDMDCVKVKLKRMIACFGSFRFFFGRLHDQQAIEVNKGQGAPVNWLAGAT